MRVDEAKAGARGEPGVQLNAIGQEATRIHDATGMFPTGTARMAPTIASCCTFPGQRCPVNATVWQDAVWKALGISIQEPSQFRYDYTGSAKVFTAKATGDLDCDEIEIVYTMLGFEQSGVTKIVLTEPQPGAD
jgi:hypothetical protein